MNVVNLRKQAESVQNVEKLTLKGQNSAMIVERNYKGFAKHYYITNGLHK